MAINILTDHVINQISAGEVVERPASIVKELLDNSLDAKASEIKVSLVDGGQTLISVTDNGTGMTKEDAVLAFKRHATSKLSTSEDIERISTFGFRGEALPSIAAVAKVRLRTRTAECQVGTEVRYRGGELEEVKSVPARTGTMVEVQNLFFNTPARKKFLKSSRGEELKIKTLIKHTSIANPHVRFVLTADKRELLDFPISQSMTERASTLFKGAYIPFRESVNRHTISGLIGHPSKAGLRRSALLVYVNGRLVNDSTILRATRDGFESTIKGREFPSGFINIDMPPELVDVNVHPQKSEVRFRDPQEMFLVVRRAVRKTVQEFITPVEQISKKKEDLTQGAGQSFSAFSSTKGTFSPHEFEKRPRDYAEQSSMPGISTVKEQSNEEPFEKPLSFLFSDLRYLGQVLDCYLLCEMDGKLVVVDMHAAHERYNYNLVRNAYKSKSASSQQLLAPLTIEASEEDVHKFAEFESLFSRFGFDVEVFGDSTLLVRAVPPVLNEKYINKLFEEVLSMEFSESAEEVLEQMVDAVAARIACHSSVRSGQKVNKEQVYSLFASLDRTEFSAACPHGRPVIVSFSRSEVERWFGRI